MRIKRVCLFMGIEGKPCNHSMPFEEIANVEIFDNVSWSRLPSRVYVPECDNKSIHSDVFHWVSQYQSYGIRNPQPMVSPSFCPCVSLSLRMLCRSLEHYHEQYRCFRLLHEGTPLLFRLDFSNTPDDGCIYGKRAFSLLLDEKLR